MLHVYKIERFLSFLRVFIFAGESPLSPMRDYQHEIHEEPEGGLDQ